MGARITVIDLDGTVLGDSWENREMMDNHSDRAEVIQAVASGQGRSIRYSNTTGYEMLYYAKLVTAKEQPVVVLRLALPLQAIDTKLPTFSEPWLVLLSWSQLWLP